MVYLNQEEQNLLLSVGQQLRHAREQKGLSLEEVAEITRISFPLLQGLEAGNIETNPGFVFVRGFSKAYARLVDLDESLIQEALNELCLREDSRLEPPPWYSERKQKVASPQILVILILVVLIGIGYLLVQWASHKRTGPSTPNQVEAPPSEATSQTSPAHSVSTVSAQSPQPLTLSVHAQEMTWIGVQVDQNPPFETLLQPGDRVEWSAREEYKLTVGNTKAVEMALNNQPLDLKQKPDLLQNWVVDQMMLTARP